MNLRSIVKMFFILGTFEALCWPFEKIRISRIFVLAIIGALGWVYHENQNIRGQLILERASNQHHEDTARTYANALRYEIQRSERLETAILPVSDEHLLTQ